MFGFIIEIFALMQFLCILCSMLFFCCLVFSLLSLLLTHFNKKEKKKMYDSHAAHVLVGIT